MQNQIQNPTHFEPTTSSGDDFLDQMLCNIPSNSWSDLIKSSWDNTNPVNDISPSAKSKDLPNETTPSLHENAGFHCLNDHSSLNLASKLRQTQINSGSDDGGYGGAQPSNAAAVVAAKLMLQQQFMMGTVDVSLPSFKSLSQGGNGHVQTLYNDFSAAATNASHQQFHNSQLMQNFRDPATLISQPQAGVPTGGCGTGGTPAQTKQRVRARRGQATDPHSIAERLRRMRIAERMKALQELVPNVNKTDKATMLDEIIDYVKFLQLQVKVLSMSRLGGAAAVAPLVADIMTSEQVGTTDRVQASNGNQTVSTNDSLTITEQQVAKLMEEDMGSAMQYLQGKGLCLMPISLATTISVATKTSVVNGNANHSHPFLLSNGEGPTSPNMSVLTVQSATTSNGGRDGSVKDAASVSKP